MKFSPHPVRYEEERTHSSPISFIEPELPDCAAAAAACRDDERATALAKKKNVPSSWTAIMRSASLGPRRTRKRPTDVKTTMSAAAPSRKLAISILHAQGLSEQILLGAQLRPHWLIDVETMDRERIVSLRRDRHGSGQDAN
jgi:hypothetical protein